MYSRALWLLSEEPRGGSTPSYQTTQSKAAVIPIGVDRPLRGQRNEMRTKLTMQKVTDTARPSFWARHLPVVQKVQPAVGTARTVRTCWINFKPTLPRVSPTQSFFEQGAPVAI